MGSINYYYRKIAVLHRHNYICWGCKERINMLTNTIAIHHKNHNREDNRLVNLKPMHTKCHNSLPRRKMTECKKCGEYMNPVQAMLSATHGVCGDCTRKNQKFAFIKNEIPRNKIR